MKRLVLALSLATAVGALVTAQSAGQTPAGDQQKPSDISLTGCLIQGSGPTVFLFDNAKKDAQSTTEKGKTYVLVAGSPDLNLANHLNHKLTITGAAEAKTPPTPPAGEKVAEKDLPKLTAKSLTMIAETCSPTTVR